MNNRKAHDELCNRIRVACAPIAVLWQNKTNKVLVLPDPAKKQSVKPWDLIWMSFGLITGSSDLIGLRRSDGRFIAIEVKTGKGRQTPEQKMFLDVVRMTGGIALEGRDVSEVYAMIEKWMPPQDFKIGYELAPE